MQVTEQLGIPRHALGDEVATRQDLCSVITPFERKNINDGFGHESHEDTKKAPH
jgi:hypothetical protein